MQGHKKQIAIFVCIQNQIYILWCINYGETLQMKGTNDSKLGHRKQISKSPQRYTIPIS